MLTAVFALFAAAQERPDLVLSGDALPPGAVARFGIPNDPMRHPRVPHAAGYSDEGSFRVAVADGKDVRVWTWHAPGVQPPKHLFRGLPAEVTRITLSRDGRTLAAGDKGGDLRVWDLATGDELLALEDEPTQGTLAVGPRGRLIFRAGTTGCAVWETTTKKRLAHGEEKRSFVAAAFSPDGKLLVTADKAGKLDLWESRTLKRVGELAWEVPPPPKKPAFGQVPKPKGERADGLFHVIDPPSPEHDGGVIRILFSADGKRVFAAGASVVRAWDTETRKELWRASHSFYFTTVGGASAWSYDSGKLSGADISADGKYFATADVAGHVRLLDAATGKDLWVKREVGHFGQHNAVLGVAFHQNGKWLATHAAGNYVDLWDIRTGVRLATTGGHHGAANGLAFSPDGKYLASHGEDHFIDVYDLGTRRTVARALARVGHGNGFGFTANGKYIVTGAAYSGSYTVAEFTPGARPALRMFHERGSFGSADATCIDPRAPARIVVVWYNQAIHGEDIPTRKWVGYGDGTEKTIIRPNDRYYHVALAADADRLVIGTGSYYDRPARVYDLKTGKEPFALEDNAPASDIAITPDGKLIAGVAQVNRGMVHKREFRVWDGTTGKRKFMIDYGADVHGSPPAFSPDGKRVAIGVGGEIVLIDTATGKEVARAKGHQGATWRVAFSPDGKRMASSGGDGQTLLWDVDKLPVVKR